MPKRMFRDQFEWLSALPLLAVTGALVVIALGALAGAQSPDARWREVLFDYFGRLAPADYDTSENFHLVLIDRESVDAVGPWPWPRTVLADLVAGAAEAGAKAVILTEPVDAPDPLSPETIGKFWLEGASDETLAQQLSRLPRTDAVLADAFDSVAGAVAVSRNAPDNPNRESALARVDVKDVAWIDPSERSGEFFALPAARYFYGLDADLAQAARPAIAALAPDSDGVVRRTPLLWALEGAPAPSIALEAARLAADAAAVTAETDPSAASSQGRMLDSVSVGQSKMRVSNTSALRLFLPRRIETPSTSAARLLTASGPNSQLAGAVVLIGRNDELGETIKTARGAMTPAALHALAAAQLVAGDTPRRPGWTGYLEALAVMLLGAAAVMTAQRMQFWHVAGGAAGLSLILMVCAFAVFAFGNVLINPLPPALALFAGALSVAGGKSIGGVLRDDSLRGSFHDALPEPAMKRLREENALEILEGAYRDITVLACELRLADEDLRTMENLPDDVTKLLASASLDLRQTIIAAGGAADQAEGGRLFAYYNAPMTMADHVQAGCAAALRLIESMDKINTSLDTASRTRGLQMHLAIGIATGRCFVGPMGHGRHNRYSAIGPAVDRAAFLRNQSEYYGPAMICDEAAYRQTHHHFAYLELDRLRTRNAERPFSIYALIGNPFIKSSKGFRDLDEAHRQFLTAYRAGDLAAARERLDKSKLSPGAKIALFDIYEERLAEFAEQGFPENWDGAHTARV